MKPFNLYFFSPEAGGTWWETTVYAKTLAAAKDIIANKYYIEKRMVFAK